MTYSIEELEFLVGPSRLPHREVPAAWWITVSDRVIKSYAQWKADYKAHLEKVRVVADSIGVGIDAARIFESFDGKTTLSGFIAPPGMTAPAGWRLDREGRFVPSRRTKADRESEVAMAFAAVRRIPDVRAYMYGLPTHISLPNAGGSTLYFVNYWDGQNCVFAFTGADPDRSNTPVEINKVVWERQPVSAFVELRGILGKET